MLAMLFSASMLTNDEPYVKGVYVKELSRIATIQFDYLTWIHD